MTDNTRGTARKPLRVKEPLRKPAKPGQKPMYGVAGPMKVFTIRLPEHLHGVARRNHALVRKLIEGIANKEAKANGTN